MGWPVTNPAGGTFVRAPSTPPTASAMGSPVFLGILCGVGAALFWALGFVATRHGLKAGFTPADLLMHRFLWSGLVFLPFVFRAGWRDLCGIGWGRGLALMVLGTALMGFAQGPALLCAGKARP